MPPKTYSGTLPRRSPRATARKSTPNVSSVKSITKSPPPPPPTLTSSTTGTTTKSPCKKDTYPEIAAKSDDDNLSEAQATPEAAPKSESMMVLRQTNANTDAKTIDQVGTEKTLPAKMALPYTAEGVVITAAEPGNFGESGREEGGAKKGRKTVVKKMVRVVKKVVKKKVPKRVPKGNGVSANEESEKPEAVNSGETAMPSALVGEEVGNPNPNPVQSVPMEVDNSNTNDTVSVVTENLKSNIISSMEAENSNSDPSAFASIEAENPNSDVDASIKAEDKESEVCEETKDASVTENSLEAPILGSIGDKNNGDDGEKTLSVHGTQPDDQSEGLIGDPNGECKTANKSYVGGEGVDGVKEEVERGEVSGLKEEAGRVDGVFLSGEMEALERQRRRKKEIFIGGLDKDTQEEDVRKVFEEVGQVVEVRLMMNGKTGKNKGFAFVRYAAAADAKKALAKFCKVEICGKQCGTSPVEGNDTIFLGNIDKKWKSEDVVKLLQEIGVEKIDKVNVIADPDNVECNRGFAFLELESYKDAQNAYNKLQKKDTFGKHLKVKVAWAEPLIEPDEEEMLKVKSVYAEYIPSSWDEEKVRDYFKKFGEIENVVLARNLRSSRRKDFAFVNYTTREAALACIEAFSREQMNDEDSKVNVKVSLARPIPKGKQIKHVSHPTGSELSKEKRKAAQPVLWPHEPRNQGKSTSSNYEDLRVDRRSSTTAELVQLLREQASWRQTRTGLGIGSVDLDYPYPSPGRKRPFSELGDDPLYSDPRGYPRPRMESSYPIARPSYSALSQGVGTASLPNYHRQGAGYATESAHRFEGYPNYLQPRERAPYHGSSDVYHRY